MLALDLSGAANYPCNQCRCTGESRRLASVHLRTIFRLIAEYGVRHEYRHQVMLALMHAVS